MKFGNKDNKYIILKNGNNYGFIFGTVITFIVFVLLITSKMWLPDDRTEMIKNTV